MIINPKRILLSLSFSFCFLLVWAQENNCITFEQFEPEQNFGARSGDEPGSVAFTQGDVKVTLEPFQYFDGSTDFWNATVYETLFSDFELADGKSLFVSNINLKFDFTALEKPVRKICMAYFDGGGEENISVNGSPIFVLNHFGEAPQEIAPGVTLTIEPPVGNNQFLSTGMICLEGDIKTLLIGGQEFGLDNICWDTCPIYHVTAGITGCQQHPNLYYEYDIQLNFLHGGPSVAGFGLSQNGEFIGNYEYAQLPLTLPNVPNFQGLDTFVYTICTNDNQGCCREVKIPLAPCEDICQLEARVEEVGCNDAGTEYIAAVAIEGQNVSDTLRVSNSQGLSYLVVKDPGTQLIEIGFAPQENSVDLVTICDYDDPSCCYSLWIQYPCVPSDECQFNDFEAVILECYETDAGIAYDVKINFEPSGMSNEFFDLHSREGFVDTYRFDQLPITLSGYVPEGNPDNLWFKVREENDNPDCQAVTEVATGECQASNCAIENVTLWEIDCNATGTEYIALVSIEGQGLSNKFKATNALGEVFYGEYPPAGHEIELGFSTRESGTDRIEICDAEFEGCCFILEVEYPCQLNTNCEINGLEAYILDCYETDAGTAYDVKINFQASGTNNEFFDLYGREGLIDFFPFEQLPITVNGYVPEGNPDYLWFKVTENDNPECQAVVEVATGECTASNCVIENVTIWDMDCNASGTEYLALISIQGEGLSNKFKATNALGETFYYEYPPAGSEVQIGFSTNESGTDRIEICDYANPECCQIIELEYPCQPTGTCEVKELEVSVLDCEETGAGYAYDLKIDFEANGFSSEYVDLYLDGEWFDTFALDQRPITISNYLHNPNSDGLTVKVSESGNLACHQVISVPLYPCDNSGECYISEVIAEAHNCDGNTYLLDVAFQSSNPGPLGYYVYGDGAIFGPYSYEEPFVTIGPFEGDGETIVDILILDIANPSCFGYLEYGPLDCETQCRINEVYAEQLDCVDGGFYVQIGFEAENMGPEGFTIRGNGQNYGSFSYDDVPLMVGPIEANSDQVLEFIIIDNSNPNCRAFTTLEPIDCPNCEIEGLNYTVDCQETSLNFTLELDFIANDPDSEHFYLKFDEEIYERFSYAALPIAIDLPLSLAEASKISVCDTENPDCCQTIDFNIPCCSVRDLVVEAHPCEEDGTFLVDLNLLHTNTGDSFTLVYGPVNGDLQSAQHTYEELFLTLGPLNGMNEGEWLFQVTDESLFCSTSEQFTFETCEPAECIGFEDADTGSFGPLTGYEEGAVFLEESEVLFRIASSCECFVHLVEYPSVFPAFTLAQGKMMVLDGSGVEMDLSNVPSAVEELNIDYYFDGNTVTLQVNGQDQIVVDKPANLPSIVAAGVNLAVTQSESDPNMGTLTFTGNVDKIKITIGGKMSLDNLCITLGTEEVWPGDINTDNIANHFDLLPLGIAQGVEGPIRENETTEWQGIPAAPWNLSFPNGLNYKHADTDGNGFIDSLDKAAILDNFLLTHGEVTPFEPIEATPNNPTLFIETPNEGWPTGQAFSLPIVLGSPTLPVEGLHGIAFSIRFDPQSIDPSSIALDFSNSWLGDDGHDLLTLDRTAEDEGVIYVALSRVGPQELFGNGPVASLIGIIDDIAGRQVTTLSVEAPLAVTATLDTIPIFTQSSDLIIQRFQEVPKLDLLKSLVLSPNPTNDEVRIWNKFGVPVDQVDVMDSAGNLLTTVKEGASRISLKSQPAGVYMLRIRMGGVIAHRRIIRL